MTIAPVTHHTGESLYAEFARYMDRYGVEVREWNRVGTLDKGAWEWVATIANQKRRP